MDMVFNYVVISNLCFYQLIYLSSVAASFIFTFIVIRLELEAFSEPVTAVANLNFAIYLYKKPPQCSNRGHWWLPSNRIIHHSWIFSEYLKLFCRYFNKNKKNILYPNNVSSENAFALINR